MLKCETYEICTENGILLAIVPDEYVKLYEISKNTYIYDRNYFYIAIDHHISVIGSFNMDIKSAYQDTETMLVIDSEELNSQLRAAMEYYQKSAEPAV